jgi:hypothetical protein
MAELIGVISGVAAIAGVGFKLFKSLNDLAGSIGDAGKEISLIATEIRIFAEVLVVVRASLNDRKAISLGLTFPLKASSNCTRELLAS